jgi:hypothetical protein
MLKNTESIKSLDSGEVCIPSVVSCAGFLTLQSSDSTNSAGFFKNVNVLCQEVHVNVHVYVCAYVHAVGHDHVHVCGARVLSHRGVHICVSGQVYSMSMSMSTTMSM